MRLIIPFVVISLLACCKSGKTSVKKEESIAVRDTSSGQKEINLLTDSVQMPITGIAENRKGGAVLVTDNQTYWIENLHSWDDQLLGRPVRVWGEVIVRSDNPVFLDTSKEVSQGIPVETEQELRGQQNRFWILNPKYELVRP